LIGIPESFEEILIVVIVGEFVFDGPERGGRAQGSAIKMFLER